MNTRHALSRFVAPQWKLRLISFLVPAQQTQDHGWTIIYRRFWGVTYIYAMLPPQEVIDAHDKEL